MQKDTIIELLNAREYIAVKNAAIEMNEVDLAELFEEIYEDCDAAERESIMLKLFRLLTKDAAAEVFAYLDSSVQQVIIEALTDTELKHIIDDLYLDDCVDMIEEMPASVVKRVLKNAGASFPMVVGSPYLEPHYLSHEGSEYLYLVNGSSDMVCDVKLSLSKLSDTVKIWHSAAPASTCAHCSDAKLHIALPRLETVLVKLR